MEVTGSGEGNVQRKVGFGDDFLPELPPTMWGNVGGRVSGSHVTHSEFSRNRIGTTRACRAVRHGPAPSRPANLPCISLKRPVVVRTMIGSIGPTTINPARPAKLPGSRQRVAPRSPISLAKTGRQRQIV